jgi:tRNA (guanine-N7-)-methyltransferase
MPIRTHDVFTDYLAMMDTTRNPYVLTLAKAQSEGSLPVAFGPDLRRMPGSWRTAALKNELDFSKSPLIVEIGCHYGHTLVDMAQAFPDIMFVGIDITFKRVVHTAERIAEAKLKNCMAVLANAQGIGEMFAPQEVSGFVTFFPDPWVKKKHAHNRLYGPKFLPQAKRLLEHDGFLWLKTDAKPYFDDALMYCQEFGFSPETNLKGLGDADFSSAFLRRFDLKGIPWYQAKWKQSSPCVH